MERRRFRRLATRVPLHGRSLHSVASVEGMLMNIGEGGFSFEARSELRTMDRFTFEISPPESETGAAKLVVPGQVRWCSPGQGEAAGYWIGVMFLPTDASQQAQIRAFVERFTVPEG